MSDSLKCLASWRKNKITKKQKQKATKRNNETKKVGSRMGAKSIAWLPSSWRASGFWARWKRFVQGLAEKSNISFYFSTESVVSSSLFVSNHVKKRSKIQGYRIRQLGGRRRGGKCNDCMRPQVVEISCEAFIYISTYFVPLLICRFFSPLRSNQKRKRWKSLPSQRPKAPRTKKSPKFLRL